MPGFGITAVGVFPPASDNGFPRFIQFQQDGVDVGDTTVETVNFTGDASLTVNSGGGTLTVDVGAAPATMFTWSEQAADYTLALSDANNGIAATANTGAQTFTVPPDSSVPFDDGTAVLLYAEGAAQLLVVPGAGVDLQYRVALLPQAAGQFSAMTLIKRSANTWLLCGDLELA